MAPRGPIRWLTEPEVALPKFDDDRTATTEVSQIGRSRREDRLRRCAVELRHRFAQGGQGVFSRDATCSASTNCVSERPYSIPGGRNVIQFFFSEWHGRHSSQGKQALVVIIRTSVMAATMVPLRFLVNRLTPFPATVSAGWDACTASAPPIYDSGKLIVTSSPPSGRLRARTWPPWEATARRAMARPRP